MGSLASRPKAPKIQQQPVYIPAVTSPPPAATGSSGATTPPPPAAPTDDDIAAQARGLGLLSRSRGGLSTILTGFRGILSQNNTASQRKTLLGE